MANRKEMANRKDSEGNRGRSMSKLTEAGAPAEQASRGTPGEEDTRDALYQRAAALGINGRSRMDNETLARAVAEHEAGAM